VVHHFKNERVLIVGDNELSKYVLNAFETTQKGMNIERVLSLKDFKINDNIVFILCDDLSESKFPRISNCLFIDAYVNAMSKKQIEDLLLLNNKIFRVEMHADIHSEACNSMDASARLSDTTKGFNLGGLRCVSNGEIGREGTIVLDSVTDPRRVLGIADGCGRLKAEKDLSKSDRDSLLLVSKKIVELQFL
jgi:hypothetical protein